RLEADQAGFQQDRDELNARLRAELSSGREAKKRADALADHLSRTSAELNRTQRLLAAQARQSACSEQRGHRPGTKVSTGPTRNSTPNHQTVPEAEPFGVPLVGPQRYDLRP